MNLWSQVPLVRLLVPYLTGILFFVYGIQLNFSQTFAISIVLFFVLLFLFFFQKFHKTPRNSRIFGALVIAFLFFAGMSLTYLNTEKNNKNHYIKFPNSKFFIVQVTEPLLEKEKTVRLTVKVLKSKIENKWQDVSGHTMIYVQKDSSSSQIRYGDCLFFSANLNEIDEPKNPSEFNYKRFLSFHNIHHQGYADANHWKSLEINNGNIIRKTAIDLRDNLLKVFSKNGISGEEYAVGSALILGYEDKLDQEIISAYASSGALHVLSVSGLHVAIVYIVFNWLLSFLEKFKRGQIYKAIILVLLIWFYAILTGLSPSVLRSAMMLTFIIVGKAINRNTNVYNTLAVSAFVLLLINPYLIMEVGFQLSYLAVFGIIFIQPKLYELIEFDNKIIDAIWSITSVSIAAQLVTFPLGLHYFHQFPNYFLFSNLIVIPISTVIIYCGIAVFAFSKISFVAYWLSKLFSLLVFALNYCVKLFQDLPLSIIEGISISIFETWMIYFLIIFIVAFFVTMKLRFLYFSLTLFSLLLFFQVFQKQEELSQKKIVVYNIPKASAIDFIDGKKNILIADSTLTSNESKMLFYIKHNWWDRGISESQIVSNNQTLKHQHLFVENNIFKFYNKSFAVVTPENKRKFSTKKMKVDYLILSQNPKMKLEELKALYDFNEIIADASNPNYYVEKLKFDCEKQNVKIYDVTKQGAFVIDL